MELITRRLILRNPINKDAGDLVEGLNDLEISKFLWGVPHPYTKKDALEWIKKCSRDSKNKKLENYHMNIELKSEKKIVGGISLIIENPDKSAEIGYWINKKYWGNGIISETLEKWLNFAFNKLKLRRVYLEVYTSNLASNNVAKKFGFRLEGTLKRAREVKATKKIHDANIYGLLRSEWNKNKKRL